MKLRENKWKLLLSSLLTLFPILVGLVLWNRLPEQLPTHWNADGEVDQYSSRAFAVFGLPLFLLAIHWLCILVTKSDRGNDNQTKKVLNIAFWICPIISLFGNAAIYGTVLNYEINMTVLPCILLGIMFLVIGNYLPKCKHNYTIGIKIPWTLANEENWNATHRLAGKIWVAAGLLVLLLAFVPNDGKFFLTFIVLMIAVAIPTIYSYIYSLKHT